MTLQEEVTQIIRTAIPDAHVEVASPDGEHFRAIVVSPAFEGVPLLQRQRQIMRPLKDSFEGRLHALQLHTFTPDQWSRAREEFSTETD